MRGRYPLGLEVLDRAEGSAEAKKRARLIAGTISGAYRMHEVCAELGISQQRFQQLRHKMARIMVGSQERRAPGRKRRALSAEAQRIAELEAEIAALRQAVLTAQTREEIALILARGGQDDPKKKTPVGQPKKRRARPAGKRKST
jgi:transposase-like protein